jgi:hypothetical protein
LHGTSIEELARQESFHNESTWECSRYCTFPQEIVLRLNYRCEIAHIVLQAKEDRFIPEVDVLIGDGLSGSFIDVDYRRAG